MSLLFRIIYAAHANGTHHKLALDALQKLRRPDAEQWRNVMLKHVALYLEGSKDPDNKFKDFKNHVLHVKDNYWGGAPEKVENWYQHLLTALRERNWEEAAYAAGVLSHYYTDPVHPFHTGQTEAESNVHRAVEWSINRSYDALKVIADERYPNLDVPARTGPNWLREMTCDGAEFSHRYYEKLIAHYDINQGVVDPPAGLDQVAKNLVAELIAYASSGFACILDRAFEESGEKPPEIELALDTLIATLQIPIKMVQKKLTDAADRALVQRMYDELKTTGTVIANLPEDDRKIRELHAKEVLAPRANEAAEARAKRLAQPNAKKAAPARPLATKQAAPSNKFAAALEPRQRQKPNLATRLAAVQTEPTAATPPPAPPPAEEEVPEVVVPIAAAEPQPQPKTNQLKTAAPKADEPPRIFLAGSDNLEAAPSIGAKTAQRFADIGVVTVGDFLAGEPGDMASVLGTRSLSKQVISDWQAQCRLVMSVPGLRGTHAQLLVGSGYRDADAIIEADADKLCADILAYALTPNGQRLLRDGRPPDIEKIRNWITDAAAHAQAA